MKTILITGSNGFIATNFCKQFATKYKFILVSHRPQTNHITLEQLTKELELIKSIDIIINLAGANIGAKRWNTQRKDELISSRINITKQLVCIFNEHNPNVYLISASAVGIYDFNSINDENTPIDYNLHNNFSQQITKQWEQTALTYKGLKTIARFGVVLSSKGGALDKILPPFMFGCGGRIGNGKQGFPWIALDDLLSALDFIINNPQNNIVNLTAPEYTNNTILTKTIGKIWHRPTLMNLPAWVIKLIFGQMGVELLLNGNNVKPQQLINAKFIFKYPDIESCLRAIKNKEC